MFCKTVLLSDFCLFFYLREICSKDNSKKLSIKKRILAGNHFEKALQWDARFQLFETGTRILITK